MWDTGFRDGIGIRIEAIWPTGWDWRYKAGSCDDAPFSGIWLMKCFPCCLIHLPSFFRFLLTLCVLLNGMVE